MKPHTQFRRGARRTSQEVQRTRLQLVQRKDPRQSTARCLSSSKRDGIRVAHPAAKALRGRVIRMANMRNEGLSAILLEIDSDLEKAEAARAQLEREIEDDRFVGGYERPQEALEGYLQDAVTRLAIALDIAELRGTQAQLAERWEAFSRAKGGVGSTRYYPEVDSLGCPALSYLETLISAIRTVRGKDSDLAERYELNKLELLLSKIPQMIRAEGMAPQSEKDVRDVVHKYLELYFTHYTKDVQIQGATRPFKPDAGITDLKVAIEFKYATDDKELRREIGELFEDSSGYAGSRDWRRFYLILYQTKALISLDRLKAELEKTARKNWTPILVSGEGARKARKIAQAAGSSQSTKAAHKTPRSR